MPQRQKMEKTNKTNGGQKSPHHTNKPPPGKNPAAGKPFLRSVLPALLFLSLSSYAATTLQFVEKGFVRSPNGAVWTALRDGASWRSVHSATNGWSLAEKRGGAVWFPCENGATASPLRFADSATNRVSYIFAVVYCDEAADYSTLIDAPCPVAFEAVSVFDDSPDPQRFLTETMLCNTNVLAINNVKSAEMRFKHSLQLIEAEFGRSCALNEVFLGGSIVTPVWNENWRGGVAELILLRDVPSDAQRNAVRRYLAARHSLGIKTQANSAIVNTLVALGIDTFGVFNATMIVR